MTKWMERRRPKKKGFEPTWKVLGMSKSTYYDWKKKGLTEAPKLGAPTFFPPEVEDELVQMLIRLADAVMGFTRLKFREYAKALAVKFVGPTSTFVASDKWLDRFLRAHPEVSNRPGRPILPDRLDSFTESTYLAFMERIRHITALFPLGCIFNWDEVGLEPHAVSRFVSLFYPRFTCIYVQLCFPRNSIS